MAEVSRRPLEYPLNRKEPKSSEKFLLHVPERYVRLQRKNRPLLCHGTTGPNDTHQRWTGSEGIRRGDVMMGKGTEGVVWMFFFSLRCPRTGWERRCTRSTPARGLPEYARPIGHRL